MQWWRLHSDLLFQLDQIAFRRFLEQICENSANDTRRLLPYVLVKLIEDQIEQLHVRGRQARVWRAWMCRWILQLRSEEGGNAKQAPTILQKRASASKTVADSA